MTTSMITAWRDETGKRIVDIEQSNEFGSWVTGRLMRIRSFLGRPTYYVVFDPAEVGGETFNTLNLSEAVSKLRAYAG